MKRLILLLLLMPNLAFGEAGSAKQSIVVSIAPLQFVAGNLLAGICNVETAIDAGDSPATFELTPRDIEIFANARVYFLAGVPFESALVPVLKHQIPNLEVVDLTVNIEKRRFSEVSEDDPHGHTPGQLDPHVWTNPLNLIKINEQMSAHLRQAFPEHNQQIAVRAENLSSQLLDLDKQISILLAPFRGQTILVFHPAWGYFTDRYGLHQLALETNGKQPRTKSLGEFVTRAKVLASNTIFVQSQISDKAARVAANEIGARLVALDPLSEDYIQNLRHVAGAIAESFKS